MDSLCGLSDVITCETKQDKGLPDDQSYKKVVKSAQSGVDCISVLVGITFVQNEDSFLGAE